MPPRQPKRWSDDDIDPQVEDSVAKVLDWLFDLLLELDENDQIQPVVIGMTAVDSAAVDRDQASIVYNEAANMVEASPALSGRLAVVRSTKRIAFHRTRSCYKALSADVPAKEGLNAHAVLIDELHAQRTSDLWDTLRYAGASRRQPLHLSVTTAGFDRFSICWEQHQYAEQVLQGLITDPAFFAFIAAAGPADDWTDPEVWQKANPSFGITVNADQFAEDCKEAQESPAKENSFRRYRLSQWTEQDVRWLSIEKWDACDGLPGDLDGRDCYGGLPRVSIRILR